MRELQYTVRFVTPAFLGNAEQNGQWRTPPFKAQLRQWWRVAYAASKNFQVDLAQMRCEEGLLFGNAWLENAFCKSQVRLRLDRWDEGRLKKQGWPADRSVTHPEVRNRQVGSALYQGYGPLTYDRERSTTALKANAAIQDGEQVTLSLAFPEKESLIDQAFCLMHRYGTVGGRSRNGWGPYELTPLKNTPPLSGKLPLRDWRACLDRDWPHAIGRDEKGPLIWQTTEHDDWQQLMRTLAIIKIGLRTQFVFPAVRPPHPHPLPRHWLSYPITRHTTSAFERNARLPNSLRFKVRQVRRSDSVKLVGVIFHMPCLPPRAFNPAAHKSVIEKTWEKVHRLLDELTNGEASRHYAMIADPQRRGMLAPQLNSVAPLKRVPE